MVHCCVEGVIGTAWVDVSATETTHGACMLGVTSIVGGFLSVCRFLREVCCRLASMIWVYLWVFQAQAYRLRLARKGTGRRYFPSIFALSVSIRMSCLVVWKLRRVLLVRPDRRAMECCWLTGRGDDHAARCRGEEQPGGAEALR